MNNKVHILFSGDFVYSSEKEFSISDEYKKIIDNHDIFCCNLEGPIVNNNLNEIKKIGPNIKNAKSAVNKLKDLGCNLFCLANNHIFDYGKEGIEQTIKYLKKEQLNYIGAGITKDEVYKEFNTEISGLKISFLNIAENGFGASIGKEYGYAYAFDDSIKEKIKKSKDISDFVIVVSHMGAEHWDFPLPEVRAFYKNLIDCGVDLVIAHHPHVPQGWEVYKNNMIFYSLGNFIFDKGKGIQNPKS